MSVNSVQFLHVSFQEWVIKSLYPANYTVNWQFTDKNNQPKFARWSRLTWLHLCLLSCKSQCCILSTGWSLFRVFKMSCLFDTRYSQCRWTCHTKLLPKQRKNTIKYFTFGKLLLSYSKQKVMEDKICSDEYLPYQQIQQS